MNSQLFTLNRFLQIEKYENERKESELQEKTSQERISELQKRIGMCIEISEALAK